MSNEKLPSGSSASGPGGRPRAQVAYEGEDEFSTMSLDPSRKSASKTRAKLAPNAPGEREQVRVDELKSTNDQQGVLGFLRKIFAK
jgi:hypothetical protein